MILNQAQAVAVRDAMAALNNVGCFEFDVSLVRGPGQTEDPRVLIKPDGLVRVWGFWPLDGIDKARRETYPDQAAFLAAYGLV